MNSSRKTMARWKKVVLAIVAAVLAIALIAGIAVYAVWHD